MTTNTSNCTHNCIGANCTFETNVTRAHLLHHIREGIPTKITHQQLYLLPQRDDFLDPKLKAAFAAQVRAGRPLLFMPTSVCEKNDWVDGVMKYRIYLFGVLPCGSKTAVILDNVEVYVDIMVPDDMTAKTYDDALRGQLTSKNLAFTGFADIQKYRLHGFQKSKRPYKRVYFNNLQDRKKVIEYIRSLNKTLSASGKPRIETASDDLKRGSYYFPKVAREFRFHTADWNRFETYQVLDASKVTTNCTYALKVNVSDFKKLDKSRRAEILKRDDPLAKALDRDPTEVGMWDIETHRTIQNGLVPTPTDNDYTIFMMCSAYFWHYSDEALFEVCAVDAATNARKGIKLVIECGNERNVLIAHMEVMSKMAPDLTGAFNGGNFDWPLYREKLRRENLLTQLKSKFSSLPPIRTGRYADSDESVLKWCFRAEHIKIDAETKHSLDCVADFPGMLDTDVLPVFLKMYPRAEIRKSASLNFFLSKNGLESKEDMPYKRMFRIYERALKLANMKSCHCGEAQKHCGCCKEKDKLIDCKPLPGAQTMEATDYSEDLYDDLKDEYGNEKCCYCGKRNRNLKDMADVGYYCIIDCVRPQQLYVKRTIVPDKRELSTMSYVSLYDSFYRADGMKVCNVIGAYCHKRDIAFSNACSDKEKSDKDHYPGAWVFPPNRGLHSDGWVDVETTLSDGTKVSKRMRCRPITGLDFASLYPSLMMTYNLSPDMVVYEREEAEKLAAEGYTLYHIEPFEFERGEKKGAAGNQHLTKEGWTVRHNGVFGRENEKIVEKYVKYEKYEYTLDDKPSAIKFASEVGPSAEQRELLEQLRRDKVKTVRRVLYESVLGRDTLPGERMGIFSFIVKKLFDKRVPIKGEFVRLSKLKEEMDLKKTKVITVKNSDGTEVTLDYKDVVFNLNKVESKQKALKILANTFYGKSGDFKASIYELLVAAGITCAGQRNIKAVDKFVTERGFKTHYGDSVTADTPILCRIDGNICYRTIDQLGTNWIQCGDKEASECDVETWTERGWTKINRVIRHFTDKDIYRVLTHTGCVDVTSDHSLLDANAAKIKPTDVTVGTKLLHCDLPTNAIINEIDPLEAFSMGFFYGDGSSKKTFEYTWVINSQNLEHLNRAKSELNIVYEGTGIEFKILPAMESSNMYKLVPVGKIKPIAVKYRKLFYSDTDSDGNAYKCVPDAILNANIEVKQLFIEGYYAGNGGNDRNGYFCVDNHGKIGSAGLFHLFSELGYKTSINICDGKPNVYRLTSSHGDNKQRKDTDLIEKIVKLPKTTQYVYDLETENHHFAAGVGRMIVHNTDSLYLSCPDDVYADCDREYDAEIAEINKKFEGVPNVPEPTVEEHGDRAVEFKKQRVSTRVKWWDAQVAITMNVMSDLKEEVADFLLKDNGTCFLNMAYEEVGYPTVFCGKKKYFMTPHIEKINFYPKEIFIRGIDIIKQGQAKISKQLGEEFMREALSPENERELIDIAEDKIRKFYKTKLDPALFALIARYKPNKKNIPVLSFVSRMREIQKKYANDAMLSALYEPPEAGDKFEYIIVKKDLRYTLQGSKIDIKKGDQMEFLRVYKASQNTPNPMEIDLNYYMKNSIVGLFARFIAYHPKFQPPAGMYNIEDKEQYGELDQYCVDNAAKYLEALCDQITGFNKNAIIQQGRDYRAIYTRANKKIRYDITSRYGGVGYIIHGLDVHNENDDARAQSTRMIDQMKETAKNLAGPADIGKTFLRNNANREDGLSIFKLRRLFNSDRELNISRQRVQMCDRKEQQIIERLYQIIPHAARIIYRYERGMIALIDDMRKVKFENDIMLGDEDLENLNGLTVEDYNTLKEVYSLWIDLIAAYKVRSTILDIVSAIELEKSKVVNEPVNPMINSRNVARIESLSAEILPDYQWT